ncbi:MAG TPA: molybdate ABC transporter substrate-binding protein [Anaerolineales bacterium]|nr:molybdate ABC transporter substrate-binding protein [Anaerolineales bacterium]
MKRFLSLILLLTVWLAGCALAPMGAATTAPEARTLNVFAAASLTDAFTEIGESFQAAHPGVTVTFNFAGSQALRTQIEEGAPADVFASANQTEMDALVTNAHVAEGTPQVFLHNKLVVILPADNPAALENLESLSTSGIKLVLAAEEVPVGRYTREALDLMNGPFGSDFKDKVLANVVSNEDNVRQVLAKVQLGEADAGIVYTSDAVAAPELQTIEIPVDLNVIASYPIAPLVESANADLATAFVEYVLSPDGQATLEKWGFAPPE